MLLERLTEIDGVSGNEKSLRDYLIKQISPYVNTTWIDGIGNLLAEKKAEKPESALNVILSAHMDEVGLMITEITANGYLKFQTVGGLDENFLVSKAVRIGKERINGVIGYKAIHLQKKEEREKKVNLEDLYIDIGAEDKEQAEKHVKLGDYVSFISDFKPIGSAFFKGKALDDRVGCSIIADLLQGYFGVNLTAAFTVQEELGLRGSQVIANYLNADLAIVIEASNALDLLETEEQEWGVQLGQGPALPLMDQGTIYKQSLVKGIFAIAEKNKIPVQYRQGTKGRNDAGNMHLATGGIPTVTISVPCRYIHTINSVIAESDYYNCLNLVKAILNHLEAINAVSWPEKKEGLNS